MQLCSGGCRLTVPNVRTFTSSCSVLMNMLKPDAPEPVRLTRPPGPSTSSGAWALDLHTNDTTECATKIGVGRVPGAVSVARGCIARTVRCCWPCCWPIQTLSAPVPPALRSPGSNRAPLRDRAGCRRAPSAVVLATGSGAALGRRPQRRSAGGLLSETPDARAALAVVPAGPLQELRRLNLLLVSIGRKSQSRAISTQDLK